MSTSNPNARPDLTDVEQQELLAKIRASKRQDRKAEHARVLTLIAPTPCGPDGDDHGMDLGPAAHARQTSLVRVGGKLRGAGQRSADAVQAVRVQGTTLFDRMHAAGQLSDRQHAAGRRLHNLWRAAGLNPQVSARYPGSLAAMSDDDGEDFPDRDPDGATPRDNHRRLMRQLPAHMASLLDAACMWLPERPVGHPGVRYLATFQESLNRLADIWGMKQEGHGP